MKTLVCILDGLSTAVNEYNPLLHDLLEWDQEVKAVAHAPYTPSSLSTIVSGLYPASHGVWSFPPKGEKFLPRSKTIFSLDNAKVAWTSTEMDAPYVWPVENAINIDDAVRFLDAHDNCILFYHVWETHIPFGMDINIGDAIERMENTNPLDVASNGLYEAYKNLKSLLGRVDSDLSIVLTADHGEALGGADFFEPEEQRWMHQHLTLDEMVVPFYTYNVPEVCGELVNHVDFAPSLYRWYGKSPQGTDGDGLSFNRSHSWCVNRWALPEGALKKPRVESAVVHNENACTVARRLKGNDVIRYRTYRDGEVLDAMDHEKDWLRQLHKRFRNPFSYPLPDIPDNWGS